MANYYTENEIAARLEAQGVSDSAFLARFIREFFLMDDVEFVQDGQIAIDAEKARYLSRMLQSQVEPEEPEWEDRHGKAVAEWILPAWKWREL